MGSETLRSRILDALDKRVRRAERMKHDIIYTCGKGEHHPVVVAADTVIAEYAVFEKIINQITENGG